jgi:hypothetical protein
MNRLLLVSLSVLLIAGGVVAQDEAVTLRYRFVPQQVISQEVSGTGTIPLTVAIGAATGMGEDLTVDLLMDLKLGLTYTCQTVEADGQALVTMQTPLMVVRTATNMGGQPVDSVITWEQGTLKLLVNGQPHPEDDNTRKLAALLGLAIPMKMDPVGHSQPTPEGQKALQGLGALANFSAVDLPQLSALTSRLPDQPVKVGDTWEVAAEDNKEGANLTGNSTFKLAGYEQYQGVRCARIEGQARLSGTGQSMPTPLGLPVQTHITRMDIALNFIHHFDPAAGQSVSTEINLAQTASMILTTGGPMGPMQLPAAIENAQIHLKISRQQPAAP